MKIEFSRSIILQLGPLKHGHCDWGLGLVQDTLCLARALSLSLLSSPPWARASCPPLLQICCKSAICCGVYSSQNNLIKGNLTLAILMQLKPKHKDVTNQSIRSRYSTCKRRVKFSLSMIWEKFSTINVTHCSWSWDAIDKAASVHFTLGKLMISLSLSIRRKAAFPWF